MYLFCSVLFLTDSNLRRVMEFRTFARNVVTRECQSRHAFSGAITWYAQWGSERTANQTVSFVSLEAVFLKSLKFLRRKMIHWLCIYTILSIANFRSGNKTAKRRFKGIFCKNLMWFFLFVVNGGLWENTSFFVSTHSFKQD